MTHEDKSKILDGALTRAYAEIDAATEEQLWDERFGHLLWRTQELESMIAELHGTGECRTPAPVETPKPEPVPDEPEPVEPVEPEPVSDEPEPVEPVEPEPVEPEEDAPQFTMEEVRGALAKARSRGVNVAELIRSFGVDNFALIQPKQYPAVMAKLAEAGAG